jgi:hypothetical protein
VEEKAAKDTSREENFIISIIIFFCFPGKWSQITARNTVKIHIFIFSFYIVREKYIEKETHTKKLDITSTFSLSPTSGFYYSPVK